jgi:hypothetical protein
MRENQQSNFALKGLHTSLVFRFSFFFALGVEMTFTQSGWYLQNALPTGNDLYGVSFTDAGTATMPLSFFTHGLCFVLPQL